MFGSRIIIYRILWGLVQLYRTEIVARWRRLLNACAGSSVVFWKEFTYTLQTFSGAVYSGNLYWILKLLSSFFLLCLNSKMVFVYLLIVVTAAAIQQAKEVHARLWTKMQILAKISREFSYSSPSILFLKTLIMCDCVVLEKDEQAGWGRNTLGQWPFTDLYIFIVISTFNIPV